jgi:hypothetical protein
MTAQLTAAPLGQVMAEVGQLSGVQVVWLGGVAQKTSVSARFNDLPLSEALERLLGENNFLLFYVAEKEDMRLTQIWISATRRGPQSILPLSSSSSNPAAPSPAVDSTVSGDEEPMDSIIQTALHDSNAMIRLLTVSQLGRRVQEDARVKSVIAQMALSDSDPDVP